MKKFSLFLACLLATAGMVQAGLPLRSYTLKTESAVSLHEFSESATTIDYLKKGDTLGIASYDALVFLGESALERKNYDEDSKKFQPVTTGLREIGFEFPIEDQTFTKFGIGGNGLIYFGNSELSIGMVDKARSGNIIGSNFFGAYLMSVKATEGGHNNVYDEDGKEYKVMPSVILVDDDTEIKYETEDNVLYIGFKNLHVLDKDGQDKLTATYQYQVEADGTISLLVGSIVPEEEKSYFLRTALVSQSSNQFIHFKNGELDPWGNLPALVLGAASDQYDNMKFSMVPPEICSAIEGFSIDWNGKITAAPDKISFAYDFYDTEKATDLLMVLSDSDAPLKGELKDKQKYTSSSKIAGFPVVVAASGYAASFENLNPNTPYWLHVFPYNTNCADGPIYGQEIVQPVTTSIASLDGLSIASIQDDAINLSISAGTSKYILGVSNTRMCDYIGRAVDGVLKDGTTYQTGDTIKFRYLENSVSISADIEVLAVGADGETFTLENPELGTEYFFYAWAMEEKEGNVRYSFNYVETYGRTVTETPVVLDFVGKELTATPAGWETSSVQDNGRDNKHFVVTTYAASWDAPVFACENFYATSSTGTVSAWAVSPWFKGSGNLQAVFNGTFYTLNYDALQGSSPVFSKSVNDADSVIFQIQEKGEGDWRTIGRVDSKTSWTAGFNDIVTDPFFPEKEFRFRMVFYQAASSSGRYFALKSLGVEQSTSCLYPVGIVAPEDSMGYRTAKLMWTDPNDGWNSYVVKYREANDESGWYTEQTDELQIVLSGLKSGTDYVAEVNTVCSAQETSPAKAIAFRTARNIVYEQKDFEAEELSDLGFSSLKGSLGGSLSSLEDGDLGWFIIEDETAPEKPSVASLDRSLAQVTDRWLVSPVLFSGFDGKVKLTVGMSAWLNETNSGSDKERKAATGIENDTLFIYRSANRTFTAESEIVGRVVLDNLTPQYQNLEFEFEVEAAVPNVFGFYFRSIHDDGNEDNESSLGINLIKFEYTEADFPAITRLRTSNVTRTGFTARWEGEAESYALLYKKRTEEKYDTVYTENTECAVTNLEEGTTYGILVFGYYGNDCTLPGPAVEDFVTTSSAPYCGTPTDLSSEYDSETNSAVLSWTPGENNNSGTNVLFRMADNQKYDTVTVSNPSHTLENMQTNTVYYWCVQGRCNSYLSELSEVVEIKTESVANAAQDFARDLTIRVNGRQIVVENASNRFIKALNVYSATGVLLQTYAAHTNGNIFIQTELGQGLVIIEAVGAGAERVAVKAVIM